MKLNRIISLMTAALFIVFFPLADIMNTVSAESENYFDLGNSEYSDSCLHLENKGYEYCFDKNEGLSAQSKPILSVSKIVFSSAEEARGQTVTVNFDLSGENVDAMYSHIAFHVYWDDRLTAVENRIGKYASSGDAVNIMSISGQEKLENGFFYVKGAAENSGYTGRICSVNLTLPEDVQDGDVFPIDVAFYKLEELEDLFNNIKDDEESRKMKTWFFTHGIFSSVNPSDDSYLKDAGAEFADGYIAVNSNDESAVSISVYKEILYGDANCDGSVDISDAVLIMQSLSNPSKYGLTGDDASHITMEGTINGDVTGSGDGITNSDALAIQKFLLKLIEILPEAE